MAKAGNTIRIITASFRGILGGRLYIDFAEYDRKGYYVNRHWDASIEQSQLFEILRPYLTEKTEVRK